jgi:hypothetical protein
MPAALWLLHEESTGWAVFMLVWDIGLSSADNVVKPWLISQGSDMPFLLIFFGVLGGCLDVRFYRRVSRSDPARSTLPHRYRMGRWRDGGRGGENVTLSDKGEPWQVHTFAG